MRKKRKLDFISNHNTKSEQRHITGFIITYMYSIWLVHHRSMICNIDAALFKHFEFPCHHNTTSIQQKLYLSSCFISGRSWPPPAPATGILRAALSIRFLARQIACQSQSSFSRCCASSTPRLLPHPPLRSNLSPVVLYLRLTSINDICQSAVVRPLNRLNHHYHDNFQM